MVDPHGRSSVRFEKLIEGIQAHEKARILREEFTATGNADKLAELNEIINLFNLNSQFTEDYQSLIRQGQNGLNRF
jgi:hypothetical protein